MSRDNRPRLLSGLLGIPAENRERLSHVEIRSGNPRTVHCHFHEDVAPVITGELAGDPSVSDQVAEVRQTGIFGTAIDVTRRDGVFTLRLWSGPYERAAWERRMAAAATHPAALEVLTAAGRVKAQPALAALAEEALQGLRREATSILPAETLEELSQNRPPAPGEEQARSARGVVTAETRLVRMPTGHARPCVICGKEAWHTLGSDPIHQATCRDLYLERVAGLSPTPPSEAGAAPAANPPPAEAPAAAPTETAEPDTNGDTEGPTPAKRDRAPAAPAVPAAAPAVVLDADVVGLPDGTEAEHPFVIDSLAKAFDLAEHYDLGVKVTKGHTEAGQIWITAAMLAKLGIPAPADRNPRTLLEEFRASTVGSQAVIAAVQAGWEIGGSSTEGPSLGRWTWMRRGPRHALLAATPLMTDLDAQPLLEGDPSPGVLARRLALFASGYRHPFKMSAQTTAFDHVRTLRFKERSSITEPQQDLIHEEAELDGNWTRIPTDEERRLTYLHGYDRGGSYAAGLSSKGHFGVGQPIHIDGPVTLERTTYGLVRIAEMPSVGDWRGPHPLNPDLGVAHPPGPFWRHTTSLRWAQECGYEPEILEAWIWPRTSPIFSTWYERLRDARELFENLAAAGDEDATLAKDQLKAVYTRMIGQMASPRSRGQAWYAPDRRWGIVAQARVNIERLIKKIGDATTTERSGLGVWPVAWDNDTIVYASDDPDPISAWPGDPDRLGTGIGKLKWEGSTRLEEHLEYLTGGEWRGKDQLTKDWDHGGDA